MSVNWPAKDPAAVLDYVYRIPLDAGDSIAAKADVSLTQLAGTVTIDSWDIAATPDTVNGVFGQAVTAWLSGGVDGETDVFKIAWTTALTRQDDDIITLAVAANDLPALDLVSRTPPLPGHLQARYPAFADVPFATIQYWLTDAERFVTTDWRSKDYPIGLMALAAHNMAVAGLAASDPGTPTVPGGVSRFKMGPVEFDLTPQAANARLASDLTSTRYGVEYAALLRANMGGPKIAPSGMPLDGLWPEIFVPS